MQFKSIGVVGGGAWGTALAQTLSRAGKDVLLWAFEPDTVREINDHHINRVYLPGVDLDQRLKATGSLRDIGTRDVILLVPPAQHLRRITADLAPHAAADKPVVICAKGIEQATGKLMGEVLSETMPHVRQAALSGPSFASEVARGLPAALSLACEDEALGEALALALGDRRFRLYWSSDLVGVELGGAIKNVLAIAAGIVDGKGFGASAHAALVTRGFAEMRRLAEGLGAKPETMTGLSGLGDLLLTCGSPQSRNMSLGRALGQGQSLDAILGQRKAVTEGVYTAAAVCKLAAEKSVDMPIVSAVNAIVNGKVDVDTAIEELLSRPLRPEREA